MNRRILYIQFADAAVYPPLEHSSGIFADRNWDVVLLGADAFGNKELKLPAHARIRWKKLPLVKAGWMQKVQYFIFILWSLYWTLTWRPEWIYASDPLSLPILWFIRKFSSARIVYHEHDSPNLKSVQSWLTRIIVYCRGLLGREVDLCILPQRQRVLEFVKATKRSRPTFCVWNCPRVSEVENINIGQVRRPLIIYYHGSISRARIPVALIIAASRFEGAIRLQVAGYEVLGSLGYIEELTRLSIENGAPDLIEFLGTIPRRKDLLRAASKADVGLSLMPNVSDDVNMQHMVGASNKPFDCMACGLPLLITGLPEWVSTFVEPGYARACDPENVDSIEAALRWYLEHPAKRREMGRIGQEKILRDWNYETVFAPVLAYIEDA